MSVLEKMAKTLGSYTRNDMDCQSGERENEGDLESNGLQTANPIKEYFRSFINTNSRENSEITVETARMNNNEITTQVTKKLEIFEVINLAITDKVLPSIQIVLGVQKSGLNTMRDPQSG